MKFDIIYSVHTLAWMVLNKYLTPTSKTIVYNYQHMYNNAFYVLQVNGFSKNTQLLEEQWLLANQFGTSRLTQSSFYCNKTMNFLHVRSFESSHFAYFDFVFNSPKASISLNILRTLEEQEWPDSIAPWLGNSGMNLLSCDKVQTAVNRFVSVLLKIINDHTFHKKMLFHF